MGCSFASGPEITNCIEAARDWLQIARPFVEAGLALLGLGSAVSIGVLTWYLKKSRTDIEEYQKAEQELRSAAKGALDAKDAAERRESAATTNLKLALHQLESLKGPLDEQLGAARAEITRLAIKLDLLRSSGEGDGAAFWSRPSDPHRRIVDYEKRLKNSIPITVFANQKGGVGKTTLCTNLAAYFASRGERTLVVDLDYQGSCTALMLAQSGRRPDEFPSATDILFHENLPDLWYRSIETAHANLDYLSCWYSFEKLERRLEYLWAIDDPADDVRYRLARALLSPHVQTTYKRVFVDAPPRMTTGFVNGICASTHLFIPTVVDRVSAIAVGTFANQFKKLSDSSNTIVSLGGIIGTMTARQKLSGQALGAARAANQAAKNALNSGQEYFMFDATMVRTVKVSYSTEEGIAYYKADAQVREMFGVIAEAVAKLAPTRSA